MINIPCLGLTLKNIGYAPWMLRVLRITKVVGIILLALAALWYLSDNIYTFEMGTGYHGPTIAEYIGNGIGLLIGGSPQGMTVIGGQFFISGLAIGTGLVGIVILAIVGITLTFQGFLRARFYRQSR